MVITKIKGGLGNQMFQYAYARNFSLLNNIPMYIDNSFYNYQQGVTPRSFTIDKFQNIKLKYSSDVTVSGKPMKLLLDSFNFSKIEYSSENNYLMDGYWQSEKYFIENENVIRDDFSPSQDKLNFLLNTPFIDKNIVSMHIRRTDYVSSNGYHPVQSIEYYKKALDLIGDYDYIFVFSDDVDWCRNNLNFENIVYMTDFSDIDCIWLMSLCKNNIIANSSFSWWGAWLNKNPNKIVVAPKIWFGEMSRLNDSDIVPEKWIKI